jgi:hypothetical protein
LVKGRKVEVAANSPHRSEAAAKASEGVAVAAVTTVRVFLQGRAVGGRGVPASLGHVYFWGDDSTRIALGIPSHPRSPRSRPNDSRLRARRQHRTAR